MVTTLESNHLCHNSILRQQFLVDANGRSSCILVTRIESTKKKLESRSQHLNSLEEFILPVYLLETDDVVDFNELPEIVEFLAPCFSAKKQPTQRDPSCSK